jgi:Rad3-related DNA helicase
MAFKTESFAPKAAANPALHFKTLTKRDFPDVMPHQKEMLEEYADKFESLSDVALQLPTGSGKTLVGLLIADWRRRKSGNRALYLCPTKQLVRQTVHQAYEQYGIDVVDLSGRKSDFSPEDRSAYKLGKKVAISTYSGLFNTHPFFDDPDLIIIDDAHAAENYIANMWSLGIPSNSPLYSSLAEFLKPHIGAQAFARMAGDWAGPTDSMWVDKLPTPLLDELVTDIEQIIDAHAGPENPDFHYTWSLLREHLDACHVYLSAKEILV